MLNPGGGVFFPQTSLFPGLLLEQTMLGVRRPKRARCWVCSGRESEATEHKEEEEEEEEVRKPIPLLSLPDEVVARIFDFCPSLALESTCRALFMISSAAARKIFPLSDNGALIQGAHIHEAVGRVHSYTFLQGPNERDFANYRFLHRCQGLHQHASPVERHLTRDLSFEDMTRCLSTLLQTEGVPSRGRLSYRYSARSARNALLTLLSTPSTHIPVRKKRRVLEWFSRRPENARAFGEENVPRFLCIEHSHLPRPLPAVIDGLCSASWDKDVTHILGVFEGFLPPLGLAYAIEDRLKVLDAARSSAFNEILKNTGVVATKKEALEILVHLCNTRAKAWKIRCTLCVFKEKNLLCQQALEESLKNLLMTGRGCGFESINVWVGLIKTLTEALRDF